MKKYLFLLLIIPLCSFKNEPHKSTKPKVKHLKPFWHKSVNIDEPSDISISNGNPTHFFVVGNRGTLAEIDDNGHVLRHTRPDGSDYEAVCVKDNMIYAIDESLRRVDVIDTADFKVKKNYFIPFAGARNKSYEGLTYNPKSKRFVTVIEKPGVIVELNEDMQIVGQTYSKKFRELSSITYYDGFMWLLSDEDHRIMKANATDYSVIDEWEIPVINPEGIAFDNAGNILIMSDDEATLYKFKIQ
jgi:uncharacterized protein YjiK